MVRRFLLLAVLCLLALPLAAQETPEEAKRWQEEFKKGYDALIAKRYDEGMAIMKRCLELRPENSTCAYNLACGHSLQGQMDPAVEWFGKAVDWGFGYDAFKDNVAHTEKDTDLDPLRKDPRFEEQMKRMRAHKKLFDDYTATPAVYVPEAIAGLAEKPVLVVLHKNGATKESVIAGPWKKVADELGCALVAPSARVAPTRDPKQGMWWFAGANQYFDPSTTYQCEKTINPAVDQFKKEHKIDRARVWIAGEDDGAIVALRMGCAYPGLYKGLIGYGAYFLPGLIKDKAPSAVKGGLKMRLFADNETLAKVGGADPSKKREAAAVLEEWQKGATTLGFPDAIEAFTRDPKDPDQLHKVVVPALKAMQPVAVPAAAPAK